MTFQEIKEHLQEEFFCENQAVLCILLIITPTFILKKSKQFLTPHAICNEKLKN